jgi:2-phospho-L-lactate transferase/gluconeogenesis factor (CofD/UPF0052 family)
MREKTWLFLLVLLLMVIAGFSNLYFSYRDRVAVSDMVDHVTTVVDSLDNRQKRVEAKQRVETKKVKELEQEVEALPASPVIIVQPSTPITSKPGFKPKPTIAPGYKLYGVE